MRRPASRAMAPIDLDPRPVRHPVVGVLPGTPIVHLPSRTAGVLDRFENTRVVIRDDAGARRSFTVVPGEFSVGGVRCHPVVGRSDRASERTITASGSIAVQHEARVAAASRILVEGIHDAELVEKVWGDDLRGEGIVVERLDGIDDLAAVVADFGPTPQRRLGILVDHLVPGSKESRVAETVQGPHVLVTGTPYVDVWEGIRPSVVGIESWPTVPHGESWKEGVLERVGRAGQHPGAFWKELLAAVGGYTDLYAPLIGAVEALIDFVAPPPVD